MNSNNHDGIAAIIGFGGIAFNGNASSENQAHATGKWLRMISIRYFPFYQPFMNKFKNANTPARFSPAITKNQLYLARLRTQTT